MKHNIPYKLNAETYLYCVIIRWVGGTYTVSVVWVCMGVTYHTTHDIGTFLLLAYNK